ncbi:11-beta-hydroxysteroid dehydrogenase A-like [Aristolochia californica]|uniref:11-beta-hydroxysteroid dehydrogenase A-like n=1 Tax=Aristolochia californica TaxID=171875 RepID=UPI0035DCF5B2
MAFTLFVPPLVLNTLFLLSPFLFFKAFRTLIRVVRAEDVRGKVVLITGASSGIGEQLAYEYARKGAFLVLAARREAALLQVAEKARSAGSPDVVVVPVDVSKSEDCKKVVEKAVTHFGKLNHVVNNAGVVSYCPFEEAGDITRFARIMDVNFWGSVYITHYSVPHLRKSGGRVVVVSSVGGRVALPGSSFYSASKAALIMFYETLRAEIGSAVGITIVCPGWIQSDITQGKGMIKGGKEGFDAAAKDAAVGLVPIASAEGCARAIVKAANEGRRYLTWPSWYRLLYVAIAIVPSEMLDFFNRSTYFQKLIW